MSMRKLGLLTAALLCGGTASVLAACPYKNEVPLKSLTAGFEAWKSVTSAMAECGNFKPELDQEFAKKYIDAFAARPALYHFGGVANETMVPLLNAGTIRPLDDLVAKYGKQLSPNQLIKVDGKVMAIAMMVNAQHLMYRRDILETLKIAPPTTYAEVLAAAEKIKAANAVPFALGATMKSGWNLAQDFVNMYLGHGGQFFGAGNSATINNPAGIKTLETMKALTAYMDPEYLAADSTVVQQQFQQGKIAMANLWASRAGALDKESESKVVGKVVMAAAPLAMAGGKPATTLWWDGIVIAKNITDAEADAAFRLAMIGLSKEMVMAHNDDAVWLIEGFKPSRMAEGAIKSTEMQAPAYPASPQLGLMQTALGNTLADYFTGKASAADTLAKTEAAYTTAAKSGGLIK